LYYISNLVKKITINIHGRKTNKNTNTNNIHGRKKI
jgi:hypothetical protein